MPTETTTWIARDGTSFNTEAFAIQYEVELDLMDYMNDNFLEVADGFSYIDGHTLMTWLKNNPRIYIQLLPEESE